MADIEELLTKAKELVEAADGFAADAEFRQDLQDKAMRYLQAFHSGLQALSLQNEAIVELLKKQEARGGLGGA